MKHLLGVEGLSREEAERILDRAESFAEVGRRDIKKVPTLRGRTIVSLFYESSTRTSSSFELAAKRLSADVVSIKSAGSAVDKGESLKDTIATLSAYDPAAIVIRSPQAGAADLVAGWTDASVINAGDGKHEHPSQALLDVFTLRQRLGSLEGTKIWIVGDVLHSRVARSCLLAFGLMGAEVTLCGPPTLIPRGIAEATGVSVAYDLDGLGEADVVYALRMQNERMSESFVPSLREYAARYQIDARRLGPRQLLMHPGPGQSRGRAVARGDRLPAVADHRPGRERPGGADGDPLRAADRHRARQARQGAGARRPAADRTAGVSAEMLVQRDGEPAELVIRGARVLDPREGIDAVRDIVVRDGVIAELAEPAGAQDPEGAEVVEGEGLLALPAFVDPHVHFRVPGQEHKEDLETGTRAAAAGGYCAVIAMANTEPPIDSAAVLGSVRELAEREASVPVGFVANVTRGMEGAELTEMAELRDAGRDRLLRRRASDPQRPRAATRAPVPAPRRRRHRPARGGPGALGRGRHARGRGLGGARPRRRPLGLGVDDDRPRLLARPVRGRADTRPAPLGAGLGRGDRPRQGGRRAGHLRGEPPPPDADGRAGAQPRLPLQDEPARCAPRTTARL